VENRGVAEGDVAKVAEALSADLESLIVRRAYGVGDRDVLGRGCRPGAAPAGRLQHDAVVARFYMSVRDHDVAARVDIDAVGIRSAVVIADAHAADHDVLRLERMDRPASGVLDRDILDPHLTRSDDFDERRRPRALRDEDLHRIGIPVRTAVAADRARAFDRDVVLAVRVDQVIRAVAFVLRRAVDGDQRHIFRRERTEVFDARARQQRGAGRDVQRDVVC
jgi:hypothetical protein